MLHSRHVLIHLIYFPDIEDLSLRDTYWDYKDCSYGRPNHSRIPTFKNLRSFSANQSQLSEKPFLTKKILPALKDLTLTWNPRGTMWGAALTKASYSLAAQIETLSLELDTWLEITEQFNLFTSLKKLTLSKYLPDALDEIYELPKLEELVIEFPESYFSHDTSLIREEGLVEFFEDCEEDWIHRVLVTIVRINADFKGHLIRAALKKKGIRHAIVDRDCDGSWKVIEE